MRLVILLAVITVSGCAAPVLITKPMPNARIGVVSLLYDYPSHFVESTDQSTRGFRVLASMTNFGNQYLAATVDPLLDQDFDVSQVLPSQALIDRRTVLFQGGQNARDSVAELKRLAEPLDLEFAVVVYPKSRVVNRRGTDVVFVEGYGVFSLCIDGFCHNRAVNSVSAHIVDLESGSLLAMQDYDYFVWADMPEDTSWARSRDVQELPAEWVDQGASAALEKYRSAYLDMLIHGGFVD
ncbi:MAG: hypothetical protein AAFV47_07710 [Pseudomonadota bacterium]